MSSHSTKSDQNIDLNMLIIRQMGCIEYQQVWAEMQHFTDTRDSHTPDELWFVEHPPVFTQGQAGKPEHLLSLDDIPLVQTDRGGQVTYHGPGQLVAYPLINLKRKKMGVRELVTKIERSVVELLAQFDVCGSPKPDAPGVYISNKKIASLGLRVRRGCSFHGVAINIDMDLSPFLSINPCGYAGLEMVNLIDFICHPETVESIQPRYAQILADNLGSTLTL